MESKWKLYDAEYRMADIVWRNEPLHSRTLAELCQSELGWKRSTTYTVLKKLCDRGILQNENATVTARVSRAEAQRHEAYALMEKSFDGSLPQFIAAFLGDKKLSGEEAAELKRLVDAHRGG